MKTIFKNTLTLLAFVAFYSANAQEAKHNNMASWAELKAFHVVMSQTFHPAEEGNLAPIRERSGELYTKAVALANSKAPAEYNKPEIMAAAKDLTEKTKQLNELVKAKGDDTKVKELLTATHNSFHKIVGLCNGGEDHDQRKEEHKE
jgi:hypothetical protein